LSPAFLAPASGASPCARSASFKPPTWMPHDNAAAMPSFDRLAAVGPTSWRQRNAETPDAIRLSAADQNPPCRRPLRAFDRVRSHSEPKRRHTRREYFARDAAKGDSVLGDTGYDGGHHRHQTKPDAQGLSCI
jgi:hypothetical protein